MKVLHVIPSLSPKKGGPSVAAHAMAQAVVGQDMQVHVVATDEAGTGHLNVTLERPIDERGVVYRYFRCQTPFYTASWPLTRWLAQHIDEYDVVHIHALFSYSTIPAAIYALRHRVPYILRPLGTLNPWGIQNRRATLKKISLRLIEQPLLARAAAIHYTCEQEQRNAELLGIKGRSVILPLGINLSPFCLTTSADRFLQAFPTLRGKTLLLYLSRLHPIKGLDILLPAFAQLLQHLPDTRLILAGDGDSTYIAHLHSHAKQLGIEEKIVWPGFLTGEDKLSAMAASRVFVLPSYSENFGIAVIEAMAAGLPVVVSDQVGIHYEISEANAGFVVPPIERPVINALLTLLHNDTLHQQMGNAAKQVACNKFSTEVMHKQLLILYNRTISENWLTYERNKF